MLIKAKRKEYNAKEYFESWHRSVFDNEFSDRVTISPAASKLISRYHYNLLEINIIESFIDLQIKKPKSLLDIGSGAGHWIDFYMSVFGAKNVLGVELSDICCDHLQKKYKDNNLVSITQGDISSNAFKSGEKFDIINAIGVMFHIISDKKWSRAIKNLSDLLEDNGVIVIGGSFGDQTQDVQFNKTNSFNTWKERQEAWDNFNNDENEEVFVNKRIRSFNMWEENCDKNGLDILRIKRSVRNNNLKLPENNLMLLKKKK